MDEVNRQVEGGIGNLRMLDGMECKSPLKRKSWKHGMIDWKMRMRMTLWAGHLQRAQWVIKNVFACLEGFELDKHLVWVEEPVRHGW